MAKKKKSYMPDDDMQHDMMMDHTHGAGDMAGMAMEHHHMMPMHHMLAHAYVPWQTYEKAFPPQEALAKGTLFPELWGVYPIPK